MKLCIYAHIHLAFNSSSDVSAKQKAFQELLVYAERVIGLHFVCYLLKLVVCCCS